MTEIISRSIADTEKIAKEWLESISLGKYNTKQATIVGLTGHLGAGKTAFVKAVAKAMGVQEEVTSPTFVIMKRYSTTHGRWKYLVHIDAYRLESGDELKAVKFVQLASNPDNLIMIEWPENVGLGGSKLGQLISLSTGWVDDKEVHFFKF